jgi:hypothetical protein
MSLNIPKPTRFVQAFYRPVEGGFDIKEESHQETSRERAARHRQERREELTFDANDEARWRRNKNRVIAERQQVAQQAYDFTKPEWDKSIQKDAKEYVWDTALQETISIAVLLIEEAREYLQLLQNETYGEMSSFKDNSGLASGFKGAYDVAKDLGAFGATAKAVNINGTMNIVIENYKPSYLDLGIKWQEATPQMMKIGYALNTVKGNLSVIKGNVFVEIVFSGAINAVDYMLHDEKTLGEVVGRFSGDIAKGIVAGVIAQGLTIIARLGIIAVFGITLPASVALGSIAILSFIIGRELGKLDNEKNNYKYTKPMADKVEAFIDEN